MLRLLCFGPVLLALGCASLNHPPAKSTSPVTGSYLPALASPETSAPNTSAASPETGPELVARSLRVATYNVHMESAAAIVHALRGNPQLARADVLLFQEIESHNGEGRSRAEAIAQELAMDFAYAPGYELGEGGSHGVAMLSRFPLRDVEVIELPYYGVVVNSARRVAVAATFDIADQPVRIYSVHLDNRINPAKRRKQLAPVLRAADHFQGPVIIAGDLNTSPFCWVGSLLPIPCGLQDNAVDQSARKHGFALPMAGQGATAKWLAMRLDAIYVRGLQPGARAVERSVRLSDHLPVWVDLSLEPSTVSRRTAAAPKSVKPPGD